MSNLPLEIRGLIAFALFLVPAGIAAFSFIYQNANGIQRNLDISILEYYG